MRNNNRIAIIIPAFNEERSIQHVIEAIPGWVDDIVVVDNGSTDRTAETAKAHGARVIREPRRGYGSACLAGIDALDNPDVVVFLDGDFSDYPEEMALLVDPLVKNEADMVIGSRVQGKAEKGALTPQQRFGNRLACTLMNLIWRVRFTDLGPFRAVRFSALTGLGMRDRDYGWTVEMQIRAVRYGLRVIEVPVSYRKRIGVSKVSGTVRGVIGAGTKIIGTIILSGAGALIDTLKSKKSHDILIIFTRYPEPGKTKTRLIPALGEEGAAELQRNMTLHTISTARQFNKHHPVSIKVHYEGGSADAMRAWIGKGVLYIPQSRGDLGERMANAFRAAFRDGALNAVLVGTDCPDVSAADFQNAFSILDDHDLVVGPASDGGYYLVGLRKECLHKAVPALFKGMNWGSGDVLSDTLAAAENSGLSCGVGRTLDDIDRPEDLEILDRTRETISVIIPAIDEAENIEAALKSAGRGTNIEIIVTDGGSVDDTRTIAHEYDATVLDSAPGRAIQMNTGARHASGDILLFLHADTLLPSGYDDMVRMVCRDSSMVCGAFELQIESTMKFLRIIEKTIQFRSKWLQMPFGDQALFMKADIFREAGGFPEMPIMEDYELVKRLKRKGMITIVPSKVRTSARRWETVGFWRTTFINQLIIAAYTLGVSPSRLYRWYYRDK